MKEILLCKYGEVVLKGLNRRQFEDRMLATLRRRLRTVGNYTVTPGQSVAFVEGVGEGENMDAAEAVARTVFGFNLISRAVAFPKTMEGLKEAVKVGLPDLLRGKKSFKCEAKRADKTFPLSSPQLAAALGGMILEEFPFLRVDVHTPDTVIYVEIRDRAYLHAGGQPGAGGVPSGGGKALLLLSGGIDSPVAGYQMAKRGAEIEAIHFESFPYTSERAKEKVLDLAAVLSRFAGRIPVTVVRLTALQESMVKNCAEEYFTLLLRRSMMRIAEEIARRRGCAALITGESLGQVASQTLQALTVTDAAVSLPVFRPCIGMDKEEIVRMARQIGSFDLSTLPYEDCCTVFTPRHPKTKPVLEKVLEQERRLDFAALEREAAAAAEEISVSVYRPAGEKISAVEE